MGANVKVSSGFLFPLATAFAFLERPALFVPHASVARVEMIRANGVSSTFDVVLELQGGERLEFGQIDRAELGRVQSYMARTGLDSKVSAGVDGTGSGERGGRTKERQLRGLSRCWGSMKRGGRAHLFPVAAAWLAVRGEWGETLGCLLTLSSGGRSVRWAWRGTDPVLQTP